MSLNDSCLPHLYKAERERIYYRDSHPSPCVSSCLAEDGTVYKKRLLDSVASIKGENPENRTCNSCALQLCCFKVSLIRILLFHDAASLLILNMSSELTQGLQAYRVTFLFQLTVAEEGVVGTVCVTVADLRLSLSQCIFICDHFNWKLHLSEGAFLFPTPTVTDLGCKTANSSLSPLRLDLWSLISLVFFKDLMFKLCVLYVGICTLCAGAHGVQKRVTSPGAGVTVS